MLNSLPVSHPCRALVSSGMPALLISADIQCCHSLGASDSSHSCEMSCQSKMPQPPSFLDCAGNPRTTSFAFALFCCDRNSCSSFLMAQNRSRTLPLLSHLTLLCNSKSSNSALTSVRNDRNKRCCSADDALKKLTSFIIVFMTSV